MWITFSVLLLVPGPAQAEAGKILHGDGLDLLQGVGIVQLGVLQNIVDGLQSLDRLVVAGGLQPLRLPRAAQLIPFKTASLQSVLSLQGYKFFPPLQLAVVQGIF